MPDKIQTLATHVQTRFEGTLTSSVVSLNELTIEVSSSDIHDVCLALRDDKEFAFDTMIDICGVDYLEYGEGSWTGARFAVVYHLLSVKNNHRIRIRTFLDDDAPRTRSVRDIWIVSDWFEREAFDMFGILFEGHPDLRRILTDYGFIGHPFRKDFPLSGNVEMRYDPEKQRVIYEPVELEERILVPRVIRDDNRYVAKQDGKD
jgi:NADH-quinone oxidoreductase subunit C